IVGIDERSYRELLPKYGPQGNWPRTLYASALTALRQAGARLVVLDIILDAAKPEDPQVAAAVKRAGNIILPVVAQGPRRRSPKPGVALEFEKLVRAPRMITEAASAEGFVNVTPDPDTVVRSLPLLVVVGNEEVPALVLTTVSRFIRRPTVIDSPPSDAFVYGAGREIPVERSGRMLINFYGQPSSSERDGPFTMISFVDVLNGTFDQQLVNDKIVLVGQTIRSLDEFSTPTTTDVRMWGVEVLGNAIETILHQRYLLPAAPWVTMSVICLLALGAALLVVTLRPVVAIAWALGVLVVYILTAATLFDEGIVLNMFYPPGAMLLAFAGALTYRVVFEEAEQRRIRRAMARYLSPAVSQWVLKDPDRLNLSGETRTMTVLFCDLRGFTTLSQGLGPQALVALLNEFMTAMTEVVFRYEGVLDKYIGDAIMAFWNAPMEQPDHARRACETALDMIGTLYRLQTDWERRGVPQLDLGIGINTGPMIVGNMGSRERLAYTVLGDAVNVASRLEGLNKEYGTRVVIGEATQAAAGTAFTYRVLDVVVVKGRNEPLTVYEVLSRAGQLDATRAGLLETYQRGIELYRSRSWKDAAEVFRGVLARTPADGPSALYLRRCEAFLDTPAAGRLGWSLCGEDQVTCHWSFFNGQEKDLHFLTLTDDH
ncbi:MAG: CHASE2 domain-containing protein, partial [Nitrospiraceae bacterium]